MEDDAHRGGMMREQWKLGRGGGGGVDSQVI